MNCHYHPEVPATAYCQFCGKPLCKDCVRNVAGAVYCESCLAERLRSTGNAPGLGISTGTPHPLLAAVLGFIPGVGAMYNGQYPKAIAHVLIFSVLVSMSHAADVLGLLVAAWVFYQVFDAYQTALARRDGLPLPNPFGLNDIAQRLGILPVQGTQPGGQPGSQPGVPTAGPAVPPSYATPGWNPATPPPAAGFVPATGEPYGQPPAGQPAYGQSYAQTPGYPQTQGYPPPPGYAPVPPMQPMDPMAPFLGRRDLPVGAILLIGLGVLFLFVSLGLVHERWLSHGWPLLIIALGVWIMVRRTRYSVPPAGTGPTGGAQ